MAYLRALATCLELPHISIALAVRDVVLVTHLDFPATLTTLMNLASPPRFLEIKVVCFVVTARQTHITFAHGFSPAAGGAGNAALSISLASGITRLQVDW